MKHIGSTVKGIVESRGIKKAQFALDIGFSHAESLSRIFRSKSIQCELLEKICRVLDISPSYFFDESDAPLAIAEASTVIGNASANATAQSGDVATLRELLAEKERTIQILLAQIGTKTGQNA
jgi:DNA-binding Xre family transcriptional regulator